MKKTLLWIIMLLLLLLFLTNCNGIIEERYSKIKVGENFGSNIDGYQKKLPDNYCISVDLGTTAKIFKVPDDLVDKPYFSNSVYNTPAIVEGRFIKGFFNEEVLILCEQLSKGNYQYVVFAFKTQEVSKFKDKKDIEGYKIDSWFSLCNTIEQKIQQ